MKIKWTPESKTRTVSGILIATVGVFVYFLMQNLSSVFGVVGQAFHLVSPFISGFVLAYILNRPMVFIENKWLYGLNKKKKRFKLTRVLSILITMLISAAIVTLLLCYIIPQLKQSLNDLIVKAPEYQESMKNFAVNIINSLDLSTSVMAELEQSFAVSISSFITQGTEFLRHNWQDIFAASRNFLVGVMNFLIGIIVCIYMLYDKEKFILQGKKLLYGLFDKRYVDLFLSIGRDSNKRFSGFIIGKLIDSLIIGILTFIVLSIFQMPYTVLISVIVGVTNIIPFFGPFIGAIPSALIILMVDPMKALIFLILILLIQQLDGNVIGPKILGDTTGLSAFWVLFSILLFGGLFGFVGMIIGVPTFAVIYTLVKTIIEFRLNERNIVLDGKSDDRDEVESESVKE